MRKIYCDICGSEKEVHGCKVVTEYACRAWQQKDLDLCKECRDKICKAVKKAESEIVMNGIWNKGR